MFGKKLIIAHRGDLLNAVENTLHSFQKAIDAGADMIELDVRCTKDGVLVVHHNRLIGRKLLSRMKWLDIEKINAKRKFKIPKLEDVTSIAQNRIKLDVELKEIGYEEKAVKMLLNYIDPKDFIVTSFNDISISRIKINYPHVKAGLIVSLHKPKKPISKKRGRLLSSARYRKSLADFFLPQLSLVRLGFLRKIKNYNKPVIIWTVNNRRAIKKLLGYDMVVGIITERIKDALAVKNKFNA